MLPLLAALRVAFFLLVAGLPFGAESVAYVPSVAYPTLRSALMDPSVTWVLMQDDVRVSASSWSSRNAVTLNRHVRISSVCAATACTMEDFKLLDLGYVPVSTLVVVGPV